MFGSLKTTTLLAFIVFQICVLMDRATPLVKIADRLADSPIYVVHRVYMNFSILVLWPIW